MKAQALDAGGGVTLVPRGPDDAAAMFALVDGNREDLGHWLGWIAATKSAADARRYAQFAQAQFEQGTGFDYALYVDGAAAGGIGLHGLDWGGRSAQFGYWLAAPFRGRGVMTRACLALERHAFADLGLVRLEIRCVIENAASRAVAVRLGYTLEGTLRGATFLHGRPRDIALYARLATEAAGRLQ